MEFGQVATLCNLVIHTDSNDSESQPLYFMTSSYDSFVHSNIPNEQTVAKSQPGNVEKQQSFCIYALCFCVIRLANFSPFIPHNGKAATIRL